MRLLTSSLITNGPSIILNVTPREEIASAEDGDDVSRQPVEQLRHGADISPVQKPWHGFSGLDYNRLREDRFRVFSVEVIGRLEDHFAVTRHEPELEI
jgi:hypothetical protein